jgi:FkbM family methyltransferase
MLTTYINRVGKVRIGDRVARYYLPHTANFVIRDFRTLQKGTREPELYGWIREMPENSILFDVGSSYGQEAVYAGVLGYKVVAFNGDPQGTYYLSVNAQLNDGADITPVAALVGTGERIVDISFPSNRFYMRGRPKYWDITLQIPSVSLDAYVRQFGVAPTHLKIDVDGAETDVLRGAASVLADERLRDIFIETDANTHDECVAILAAAGFDLIGTYESPGREVWAANLILSRRG